jgi:hypothetical protein
MTPPGGDPAVGPADRVAARATGIGVGLLAFMIAWIAGAPISERLWIQPAAAAVAITTALVVGIVVAFVATRRLLRTQLGRTQANPDPAHRPGRRR